MRIAVGQVWQESNSFNPVLTRMREFRNFGYARGKDVLKRFSTVNELGGFVSGFKRWRKKVEIIPLIRAYAWPGGPLSRELSSRILKDLAETLDKSLPVDGVLFSLHGALVSEDIPDFDGEILVTIRNIVGAHVPVVATLDLHANVTEKMVANADVLIPYHTSPHIDVVETGIRGCMVLHRILKEQRFPSLCWVKISVFPPPERLNVFTSPLKKIFDLVRKAEEDKAVWSASLCMAQPWLDVPEHGWCAMAFGTDKNRLNYWISDISLESWKIRKKFKVERMEPQKVVQEALSFGDRPVVISDGADATNSGAPGDSTVLLKEFLKHKSKKTVLTMVVDPEIAMKAFTAGKGKIIKGKLGGKRDYLFSSPVDFEGTVKELSNGEYTISGHLGKNLPVSTGKTALLKIANIFVVVSEYPGPGSHPMTYRNLGFEPKEADIVIVKSPAGFRADYGSFAKKILLADCPGLSSPHFEGLLYKTSRKNMYPWDENIDWVPEFKFKLR